MPSDPFDDLRPGPHSRREARRWIRAYWADLVRSADMGGVGDMGNDYLDDVWESECIRIADRLEKIARTTP